MKYMIIMMIISLAGLNAVRAAETANEPNAAANEPAREIAEEAEVAGEPVLPEKNTTEYWVVRSQAMTEFIPFLTKKRTEVKQIRQMLADYLLKIDKADDFADRNLPVVFDGKAYAVDLILAQNEAKQKEKVMYAEMHQQEKMAQAQARDERKFEDAESRASFYSGRKEQAVESRQSRLNAQAANSGVYIY